MTEHTIPGPFGDMKVFVPNAEDVEAARDTIAGFHSLPWVYTLAEGYEVRTERLQDSCRSEFPFITRRFSVGRHQEGNQMQPHKRWAEKVSRTIYAAEQAHEEQVAELYADFARANYSTATAANGVLQAALDSRQITTLTAQLHSLEERNRDLLRDRDTAASERDRLREAHRHSREEIGKVHSRLSAAEDRAANLANQLQAAQASARLWEDAYATEILDERLLTQERDQLKRQHDRLSVALGQHRAGNEGLCKKVKALRGELAVANAAVDTLRQERESWAQIAQRRGQELERVAGVVRKTSQVGVALGILGLALSAASLYYQTLAQWIARVWQHAPASGTWAWVAVALGCLLLGRRLPRRAQEQGWEPIPPALPDFVEGRHQAQEAMQKAWAIPPEFLAWPERHIRTAESKALDHVRGACRRCHSPCEPGSLAGFDGLCVNCDPPF